VLYRDPKLTSNFLKGLFKGFWTNLNFGTTHHPELDGKTERTKKIIEDMFIMYVCNGKSFQVRILPSSS
jgi:hypothetical protein